MCETIYSIRTDGHTDIQTDRHDEGRKFANALNRGFLLRPPPFQWSEQHENLYWTPCITVLSIPVLQHFSTVVRKMLQLLTNTDNTINRNEKKGNLKYKFHLWEFLCISVLSSSFSTHSFKYESFYTYPTTFLISSEPISLSCSFWHSSRVIGPEGRRRVAIKQNRLADLMIPGATWQQIFSPHPPYHCLYLVLLASPALLDFSLFSFTFYLIFPVMAFSSLKFTSFLVSVWFRAYLL